MFGFYKEIFRVGKKIMFLRKCYIYLKSIIFTMKTADKLSNIITKLENSLSYEDWDMVESCITELNYLYEELEFSFPLDPDDDDY
jgi:flagellin-specific chaperone FliS